MIILCTLLALLQDPVRIGSAEYTPPAGWEKDPKSDLWRRPGEDQNQFFLWIGPRQAGADTIEKHLETVAAAMDAKTGAKERKTSGIQKVEHPSKLPAVGRGRELAVGTSTFYALEAAVRAGDDIYILVFYTPDAAKYSEIVKRDIEPMLDSATEFRPAAAKDGGALATPKAAGTAFARCFVSTAVPAAWKDPENEQDRAYHVRRLAVKPVKGDVKVTFPVVFEARAGEFPDVRSALRGWMESRMRPLSGERATRLTMRRVTKFVTYRRDDGAEVAAMGISDLYGDTVVAVLDAFVLRQNGCALFAGASCGPHETWGRVSKDLADPAWKAYEEVRNEMWAAGAGARRSTR